MTNDSKRLEAAAQAIHDEFCREDWHSGLEIGQACYDMKREAVTVLAAADAVMFSDGAVDRAAIASFGRSDKYTRQAVTRMIAALKGVGDE